LNQTMNNEFEKNYLRIEKINSNTEIKKENSKNSNLFDVYSDLKATSKTTTIDLKKKKKYSFNEEKIKKQENIVGGGSNQESELISSSTSNTLNTLQNKTNKPKTPRHSEVNYALKANGVNLSVLFDNSKNQETSNEISLKGEVKHYIPKNTRTRSVPKQDLSEYWDIKDEEEYFNSHKKSIDIGKEKVKPTGVFTAHRLRTGSTLIDKEIEREQEIMDSPYNNILIFEFEKRLKEYLENLKEKKEKENKK